MPTGAMCSWRIAYGAWRIVYANRRALAFWGVSADEVVGQIIWERFPQLLGTLNEEVRAKVRPMMEKIATDVAAANDASAAIEW